MKPSIASSIESLIDHYQNHLITVAGLQPSTCQKWGFFVRLFLNSQCPGNNSSLSRNVQGLEPSALLEFVLDQGEHYQPAQLQSLASALRSFCRYLCVTSQHKQDLSAALPPVSSYHREDLPTYLSASQLERLLSCFDRRTLLGKRDYAIVLCLGRLGLRAGEVSGLMLEDVDWRGGCLHLTAPKGGRERLLPLSKEVGAAIVAYLRQAKPTGPTRALFRTLDGQKPISPSWLSQRIGQAMARAGLSGPGKKAHLLRRTCATHLVQQGVSLKAVADLLGHASLRTTQVYAKVNLPMLRQVAQPWPMEGRP